MRIIYITRTAFGVLGGAASYMIPRYVSKYCDVLVLSPYPPVPCEQIVADKQALNVIDIWGPTPGDIAQNIHQQIKSFKPDIVHMFNGPNCLLYVYTFKRLFPAIKWVIDFRSPLLASNKFRSKTLWRYFFTQFYVDRVLTHSRLTLRYNLPVRFRRAVEIPPGVNLDYFDVNPKERNDLMKYVFIGSVSKMRQLDVLIRGFSRYIKDNNKQISLDIYGDGDALDAIKELILSLGVDSAIHIKGLLPQEQLYKVIQGYDVGVAYVPHGKFSRAPSLKSIEYAAAGLPIIASDTIGHREYSKRHGYYFMTFDNSVSGVCDVLKELSATGISADKLSRNRRIVERFHWDYIVKNDLLPVYRSLLGTNDV